MKAIVIHSAGDLRVEDREKPEPGPGEVRVRIAAGGICGSDLHYYHDGGFGAIKVVEPMILGHEVSGVIDALGEGVAGRTAGEPVAVNPNGNCGVCAMCQSGRGSLCEDVFFFGSAMRRPHVDGAFANFVTVPAARAVPVGADIAVSEAALSEPLAVCLHAVARAGDISGKRVLVTGCGPIGALTIAAARHAGAAEIIATDVLAPPLEGGLAMGADTVLNVAADPAALAPYEQGKGKIDVAFEASGHPAAISGLFTTVRPGGIVVQIGIGGSAEIAITPLVAKEIDYRGAFRFFEEFAIAADLISRRAIDVRPVITGTVAIEDAEAGFKLASDRNQALKVLVAIAPDLM